MTFLTLFSSDKLKAQQVYLYHANSKVNCLAPDIYYLYCGVKNRIVLRLTQIKLTQFHSITLRSDSIRINRINDSIFILEPMYKDVRCKIYITRALTGKIIDSVRTNCVGEPFRLSLGHNTDPHNFSFTIRDLRLPFLEIGSCVDYEKDFDLVSYRLIIERNGVEILGKEFVGGQIIDSTFKKKLFDLSIPGDQLGARNINIKNKQGAIMKIGDCDGLLLLKK